MKISFSISTQKRGLASSSMNVISHTHKNKMNIGNKFKYGGQRGMGRRGMVLVLRVWYFLTLFWKKNNIMCRTDRTDILLGLTYFCQTVKIKANES